VRFKSRAAVAASVPKQIDAGADFVSHREKPSHATRLKARLIARGLAVGKVG